MGGGFGCGGGVGSGRGYGSGRGLQQEGGWKMVGCLAAVEVFGSWEEVAEGGGRWVGSGWEGWQRRVEGGGTLVAGRGIDWQGVVGYLQQELDLW